jgi:hypothetical protein
MLKGRSFQRIGSRLYRSSEATEDPWDLLTVHLSMLPRSAVFVGLTAGWMHGLDLPPASPVQVALPADCDIRTRAGLEVRHCNVDGDTVMLKGLPATTAARTLVDLCARLSPVEALVALDMACLTGLIDKGALRHYPDSVPGRRGVARLRHLADLAAPAESPMETRLRWLLIKAGLPTPEVQSDLYDSDGQFVGRADLFYPLVHLVIEFDGGNHRDRLVSDDRRQNSLVSAGYRILRFTTADLYGRPDTVVAQVRAYFSGR